MRKIISKHEEARKKKRNQLIVGGVLIFIMLFSVLGYSFRRGEGSSIKKINYNGFEFTEQDNFWILNIEEFNFVFKNNPQQVEKIKGELKYLTNYYEKPLYIYSEDNNAKLEIYRNLLYQNQIVQRIQPACLETDNKLEECENLPVKNCENNFIVIKESNESKIIQNESCVFIQGKEENLTEITDEFLFKILGIEA